MALRIAIIPRRSKLLTGVDILGSLRRVVGREFNSATGAILHDPSSPCISSGRLSADCLLLSLRPYGIPCSLAQSITRTLLIVALVTFGGRTLLMIVILIH